MNILTMGWYDHNNLGDESYKDTFCSLFPQHNFIFSDNPKKELIDKCDVVLLGGGNVIKQAYLDELQKIKNKPIYGFSIGMEDENLNIPPKLFKHIYARDENTLNILKKKKIPCSYFPDSAFILQGNAEEGRHWLKAKYKQENLDLYENVIAIVVNSYILHNNLSSLARDSVAFLKFSYDLARIADETNASFVFIPFGTGMPIDDRVANGWVASKCKYWKKNLVIFDRINYKTALNIISSANLTISSRLHSSIFSYVAGTPFIDITHHSKNEFFLKSIGKQHLSVPFWNFDIDKVRILIDDMMSQPKHKEATPLTQKVWNDVSTIHFTK